ncbi:hypothetical protein GOBAR_AA05778 [Gossypium barbadense]|uniref:Uncharacterized protein n=1 Tax=Gossypium barbadense TaxID=3634 RepID=A0A2P5YGU7_GOSBA|nr:hypothetical protein GOBAR_AA05778 [Gossypium barbadense]
MQAVLHSTALGSSYQRTRLVHFKPQLAGRVVFGVERAAHLTDPGLVQKSSRDATPATEATPVTGSTPQESGTQPGLTYSGNGYGYSVSGYGYPGSGSSTGSGSGQTMLTDGSWLAGLAMGDSPRTIPSPTFLLPFALMASTAFVFLVFISSLVAHPYPFVLWLLLNVNSLQICSFDG